MSWEKREEKREYEYTVADPRVFAGNAERGEERGDPGVKGISVFHFTCHAESRDLTK